MKAPAFSYLRPKRLTEVLSLLKRHGDEARLLAGGQTLLATLNMRLSEPALLIDMQGVAELKGINLVGNVLRIGAMTTHSEIEASEAVRRHAPMLAMAAPHIAHRAIRNLGTLGGSIAYGDPAAEWPACLLALDGVVVVQASSGERRIPAQDFFVGLYTTALQAGEVITACEIPLGTSSKRIYFDELARRHGDYAVIGLAACANLAKDGKSLDEVRLAWLGATSMPWRSTLTETLLNGQPCSDALLANALQRLRSELQPEADLSHSAAAKQHLAGVMLKRALLTLFASSKENQHV